MAEKKDIPATHEEIAAIAEAEDRAGVVDQQAAVEKEKAPDKR